LIQYECFVGWVLFFYLTANGKLPYQKNFTHHFPPPPIQLYPLKSSYYAHYHSILTHIQSHPYHPRKKSHKPTKYPTASKKYSELFLHLYCFPGQMLSAFLLFAFQTGPGC